ncbi:Uncharacterized membrane protein YpjA [Paenibacillus uliginis N3/975]|uniref:Uncharacterized membrane protein YpjA n=1 Tax=Paenibacillus uliginis N3/975 TaxID=1313296 RepID=A0A1X7HIM8_9BACL|nr:DUF1405 domain-containing protein [Paenibacillus uliginis]SMF87333.1 Uncharacterized membrane protein YpjA [Paenibacillus uliginis N3/975]
MSVTYLWSREFLSKRLILWILLISNALGTVYGYIWYGGQLYNTAMEHPWWQLVFVPDSPTASLFFSLALIMLLYPPKQLAGMFFQQLIEALAVVTSVKYGIWAVAMIFAGASQGSDLVWQDWMLVASHTAMAVEALIFVKLFHIRWTALTAAIAWTLLNDTVDYTYGIFPYLPGPLYDHLWAVEGFTYGLTLFSGFVGWIAVKRSLSKPLG